jgi:Rrf2 family nitric oxide-sensitive transcriptional repressor
VCSLQSLLSNALAAFMAVLDGQTLADLLKSNRAALAARLGLPVPLPSQDPPQL